MKAFRILISLVLVMAVFGLAVKPAQAQVFAKYITGTQVMNVGSGLATIGITYYDGAGGVVGTTSDTIASFTSKTYFPPASGSAVISSDQPLAAVTNILNNNPGSETAAAAYVGASSGNTSVAIPLLMKNNVGYYTWFTVQNAGSATANVTVDYSDVTGTNNASASIAPGAASTFYQQSEAAAHTLKVFSAVVSSNQPVVVVVVEEKSSPSYLFAYNGFAKGSKNPVMPLINANNAGTQTGIQIQNIGTANSTVTVAYTPSAAGTACIETQTIPFGTSKTFALVPFANGPYTGDPTNGTTTCIGKQQFVGSAKVTVNSGNVDLVAVVNQVTSLIGEAYDAFDPADATGTVVMPLIFDRYVNYWTGFSIQNIGSASTFIGCDFTGNVATTHKARAQVAAGAALLDLQNGTVAAGFVGSATCKAYLNNTYTTLDPAGKLVGVVNELGPAGSDHLLVYEAVNIP